MPATPELATSVGAARTAETAMVALAEAPAVALVARNEKENSPSLAGVKVKVAPSSE